ncbi:Clp protease N-terminal domain-containing protein [Micromonospora chersina]|uniref:Clp protease N-terminal domain-containing protein n=1 Tax=Micromonospora chersina TaxID=47854 RepID=UPI000B86769E|nr:Clp protease N-terminal domain-containing protein [Micromonospora chersina]
MAPQFDHWTDHVGAVFTSALGSATLTGQPVSPFDLAVALLGYEHGNVALWRREQGFDAERAIATLRITAGDSTPSSEVRFGKDTKQVLAAAIRLAAGGGAEHVGTEHLLVALLAHGPTAVVSAFEEQGVTAGAMARYVAGLHGAAGAERLMVAPGWRARRAWKRLERHSSPRKSWRPALFAASVVVALAVMFVGSSMF